MKATQQTTYRMLNTRLSDVSLQLEKLRSMGASGKKLAVASDDPASVRPVLNTRKQLSNVDRHLTTLGRAADTMAAADTQLGQVENIMQRAKEIMTGAGNGTLSPADRTVLADELAQLRGQLIDLVAGGMREHSMDVRVVSFGFKYGLPLEADLVFDVRFLPNPYYIPELKHQTGLDEPVRNFVFKYQQTLDFTAKVEDLLSFLLPNYLDEGKTDLVIAVGCTGGKHRSVCIAKELYEFVSKKGYAATLSHRDMGRR